MDNSCPPPTNYFRATIGVLYLIGCFAVFYLVLAGKTAIEWKDVANIIIGALIAKSGTIVDWTFGSSQSSDHKTEIMADAAKALAVNESKDNTIKDQLEKGEK